MKKFLQKRMARLLAKKSKLVERSNAATEVAELRSINEQLTELNEDIADLQAEIDACPDDEPASADDTRSADTQIPQANPTVELRNAQIVSSFMQNVLAPGTEQREADPCATMEYRAAFMNYVRTGIVSDVLERRSEDDEFNIASDVGIMMPTTVIQSIMTGVEKVYGQLYSRVRKTNVKGGVKYPIGEFGATFKRITETTVSDRQKGGEVTGYVEFSYHIGEIRLAKTLLASALSVAAFEAELAKVIVEAYVKAMDHEIMTGVSSNNQCEGILTEAAKSDSRIPASNIIEFTAADMANWEKWQKKLFAVIPLSMRSLSPEFVMTANTYESNIKTLKDSNNRPLYNETFNPVDGAEIAKFKGKNVVFVEDDILKNFDDASAGEYFGMYWVPEQAYAINTNLQFYVTRYFDHETNQYVDKALVINDGKILDPKYIYLLKKK